MAGRIPQSFINELLARVDLVEVIDRRVSLKKAGRNYSACCPFHNEKTPSFSVNPDKQFYYCFGCGASGNALTFLMEYEGQEFVAAIEDLASQQGMEVPREAYNGPAVNQQLPLYELMDKVAQFYQQQLKQPGAGQKAVEYLKNRGLSGQIAKQYGLGYAPAEWQNLSHLDKDQKTLNRDLVKTGMMIEKDNGHTYDRFRDRIMFPIRNRRGQILGFGGRVIDQGEPKYLNSPETELFHKGKELYGIYEMRRKLRDITQIIIVEGYMDVVALAQFEIYNSVATLGTATTSEHLQTLFRICPAVVFCFDGDRAGRAAAIRALNHALPLLKDAREVRLMFLPDGEDPDSMVRQIGAPAFNQQVAEATTLFDYLLDYLTSQVDMNTFEGPAKLIHLAKSYIELVEDPILLARFLQKLAELANISEQQLEQILAQRALQSNKESPQASSNYRATQGARQTTSKKQVGQPPELAQPPEQSPTAEQNTRNKAPFRRAIALLIQYPEAIPAAPMDWLNEINEPGAKILKRLIEQIGQIEGPTTAILLEGWRDQPEQKHLAKLAASDLYVEADNVAPELVELYRRLEKNYYLDQWDSLTDKAKAGGQLTAAEKDQLRALQSQLSTLK